MRTACRMLVLIIGLLQVACNRDRIQPSQPIDAGGKEEMYSLVDIVYTPISGVLTQEVTEKKPSLNYINRTNLKQMIVVNPDSIFERSTFKKESNQNYLVDNQNQTFSVPVEIQNEQLLLGEKKWVYAEEEKRLPTQLNFKDSVYVESGKKITIDLAIVYKKIQASYTAQLKGQVSGELINVKGVWSGLYPIRKNLIYSVQNL